MNIGKVAKRIVRQFRETMAQREEILEAFVAKYGFDPDECEQVEQIYEDGLRRWVVLRLDPNDREVQRMKAEILIQRAAAADKTAPPPTVESVETAARWEEAAIQGGIT